MRRSLIASLSLAACAQLFAAEVRISELPAATTPLSGTETVPAVQGGTTKRVTVAQITAGSQPLDPDLTALGALPKTDDNLVLGNGSALVLAPIPPCLDTGGNHLNYDPSINTISCGTSGDGGGGGGGVTSVAMTVPSGFSVTGSPITTSGTFALGFATGQTANRVLATPNGSTGALSLRALVAGDLPSISLTSGVTGVLPIANGGLGVALTDPNADRIPFWDDSVGNFGWLALGTNLSITGTTLNASGGGGGSMTGAEILSALGGEGTPGQVLCAGSPAATMCSGTLITDLPAASTLSRANDLFVVHNDADAEANKYTPAQVATLTVGNAFLNFIGPSGTIRNITLPNADATLATTTGNVATATALAANGSNCTGLQGAVGVDASGAAECTTPIYTGSISQASGTSITPSCTVETNYTVNTASAGTYTVNAPTGCVPVEGQKLMIRIKSTNVQTYSWNSAYRGGTTALPTASTGTSKNDYIGFRYNSTDSKWDFLSLAGGY